MNFTGFQYSLSLIWDDVLVWVLGAVVIIKVYWESTSLNCATQHLTAKIYNVEKIKTKGLGGAIWILFL